MCFYNFKSAVSLDISIPSSVYPNWILKIGIAYYGIITILGTPVNAQIIPDANLPENSRVTTTDNVISIEGGTKSGSNLFHSFSELSVPNGSTAYFNNTLDIQNIISRVTGNLISNIDGIIKANNTANIFLINDNGFLFGKNARLEIGGSFVTSTASGIKFADGFEYKTKTSQQTPLLTVSTPIGLQFGANPGLIRVQGDGQGIRSRTTPSEAIDTNIALRVQPNQTLALVSGDIFLEGATIKTAGGRIELGSVAANSFVDIVPVEKGFSLGYSNPQNFGNIVLSQQTAADATGAGGGEVQIRARSLKLIDGSVVETSTLGSELGGNLIVNTSDEVLVSGVYNSGSDKFPGGFYAQAEQDATGASGDVIINTRLLQLENGSQISVVSKGAGRVGNLTINADTIKLIESPDINEFPTGIFIQSQGLESATSELKINTRLLRIEDGAVIDTSIFSAGNGANLIVNATESVQLIGATPDGNTYSGLFSQTSENATGIGGNLTISTPLLQMEDLGTISTATNGAGKGGNLTVNASGGRVELIGSAGLFTQQSNQNGGGVAGDLTVNTQILRLEDNSIISARTFGEGNGGNIKINATDSVQLSNNSFIGASARENSTGRAGEVTINTNRLLSSNAEVSVTSQGQGNAGSLNLNAGSIFLDSNAVLKANTTSINVDPNRPQANINIKSTSLVLRRDSNITANATGTLVIGGNININSGVLAAFENSDITANSDESRGGQVIIKAQGIFGAQFRNAPSSQTSDITAIGKTPDLSGTVQVTTPDVDPSKGLVPLTLDVVDVARLVDDNICARTANSSFTVTGRGGISLSPNNSLSSDSSWEDWRMLEASKQPSNSTVRETPTSSTSSTISNQFVEAQTWVIDKDGSVVLTTEAPAILSQSNILSQCHS
ncbi:hypothetical protein NIES2101_32720 [Calothrix sp. HK-06]|nr:hypothetical protein NIES2101_32720 [Calothrix sp. HK-06]